MSKDYLDCEIAMVVARRVLSRELGESFAKNAKKNVRLMESFGEDLAMDIVGYFLKHKVRKEKFSESRYIHIPSSWWEAFKVACFPKWLSCIVGVDYKTIAIKEWYKATIHICPHKSYDPDTSHIRFLGGFNE